MNESVVTDSTLKNFYTDLYNLLKQETDFEVMKTYKEPISAYAHLINTNVWSDFCAKYNFSLDEVSVNDFVTISEYSPEEFYISFDVIDSYDRNYECSIEGYSNDPDEPIFIAALISHEDNKKDSDKVVSMLEYALESKL